MFDVTLGSYDWAETCELIGVYMLSLIVPKFRDEVGLYRDDGITDNCKNRPECPLQGNCLKENGVYQAKVVTETTTENYVGLASNFKERYRNHQTSFRHPSKRNETELSKYIWDLKDPKKLFGVKWRVLRSCQAYSNESKKCNLCLQEKYFIIYRKDLSSLNKRNELASSCRHRNRFTLKFFRIT